MRCLAKQYGLFVGPSSGANLIAAKKVRTAYPELERSSPSSGRGRKYIQEHFAETDEVRVNAEKFA
jgi:cysteine synthase A